VTSRSLVILPPIEDIPEDTVVRPAPAKWVNRPGN
jgi:hypothetical protein